MLLIFDFDGTLADTTALIVATNQEVARRMGAPVLPAEKIKKTIGLVLADGIKAMQPQLEPSDIPLWTACYQEVFYELKDSIAPEVFPGVMDTLKALHADGHTLTVASSRGSKSLLEFLQGMGMAPYFSYVLGGDNVTNAKPHPEPVLKTLRELGYKASETLVVGDMPVDILMGAGAGAHTCGVTFGNSNRSDLTAAGADYVLDDFRGLLEVVVAKRGQRAAAEDRTHHNLARLTKK